MAYSFKGAISFGLIYIPITLSVCIRNNDVQFHMIDRKTSARIMYKKVSVQNQEKEVDNDDIVRAYEYEQDKYVIFTDDDFEKLKTKKDKNITIQQFVHLEEIDPIFYDKSYYVTPTGAEKAFQLLLVAMEQENKVGIARTILGQKELLIALRVKNGQMLLSSLYFYEELQKNPTKEINVEIGDQELTLAKQLINSMSNPLKFTQYEDEYKNRIEQAIEIKISGKEILQIEEKPQRSLTNLMDALKESLNVTKKSDTKKTSKKSKRK